MNSDSLYLIALKSIPNVGDIFARRLISAVGSVSEIFTSSEKDVLSIEGVPPRINKQIVLHRASALDRAEKELEFLEKYKIIFLSSYEDNYPCRLKHCIDAPLFLFYKGQAPIESNFVTAVVGTRKSTVYGRKMTEQLVAGLNIEGMTIISGLAYGIDTAAHQAALDNNIPTIGVMAHGFNNFYPEENRKMAQQMLEKGGMLTEFLSEELPEKKNFPIRNRIIAGLADAVVVVEAQSKGGALITAEIANSYSREVFTFPGRVEDQKSRGCNWLLRTQRAALIESAEHLKYFMNWTNIDKKEGKQLAMPMVLEPNAQRIYDYLFENGEKNIDQICNDLELSINNAAIVLLEMEFQGYLVALPGKRYQIKR